MQSSIDQYRQRAGQFIAGLEEEAYRELIGERRGRAVGQRYVAAGDLFSLSSIAVLQRAVAGTEGPDERRARALLAFAGLGHAVDHAAGALDELVAWKSSHQLTPVAHVQPRTAWAMVGEEADPGERRALENAILDLFASNEGRVDEYIGRHRDGLAELGYGAHAETVQMLTGIDLTALERDGAAFLRVTREPYSDLLAWHLREIGVTPGAATAGDGFRLQRASEWDRDLAGGNFFRAAAGYLASIGVDPGADGRIVIDWDVDMGPGIGGVCLAPSVPDLIHLAVRPAPGRGHWTTFLRSLGTALHLGYTDPTLPLEERHLGDRSVIAASGDLFGGLLRNPAFLRRTFGLSRERAREFIRREMLMELMRLRQDVAELVYGLAFYGQGAGADVYAEIVSDATHLQHDPRAAVWSVDVELRSGSRLRAAALAAIHEEVLRNRFDEDWFRNPAAGGFLRDLFSNGSRHTADDLARQLGAAPLSLSALAAIF